MLPFVLGTSFSGLKEKNTDIDRVNMDATQILSQLVTHEEEMISSLLERENKPL